MTSENTFHPRGLLVGLLMTSLLSAAGSAAMVAPTPPMGWNSWDSYGLTISEKQFRDNADVLRARLAPYGWKYAVIDEGWFFLNPEVRRSHQEQLQYQLDAYGRYVPVPKRFPSAAGSGNRSSMDGHSTIDQDNRGFTELVKWVHAQGLKFGIHIVHGIPRESVRMNMPIENSKFHAQDAADQSDACPWDPTNWGIRDNAAGQAWYDSILRQYAAWGVDFLKVDCIADNPYKLSEIRQIRRAMNKTRYPMVLSLSPGPTALSHAAEVGELSQMWRISDDIWDMWENSKSKFPVGIKSQFDRLAAWEPYAKPNNWPDADMLPIGQLSPLPDVGPGARRSRLSPIEQQTQMTLWAIGRSPLILGANLTLLDDATLRLLTNRDLIRVDQTSTGSRQLLRKGDLAIWSADLPGKEKAVAFFNMGDSGLKIEESLTDLGTTGTSVRNIWSGTEQKAPAKLTLELSAHGSAIYLIRR